MKREIVLTGLRTYSEYHLGNYIGSLLPLKRLIEKASNKYEVYLFAPDLHSFTTPIDFTKFYAQTLNNLCLFVAAGIPLDNPYVRIYRQSRISAHSELAGILSNFASFGEISRMVEFKDKRANLGKSQVSVGLFNYPILMAADILLYDAKWVPVGDDQRQHLEFCRRLAKRINHKFDQDVFTVPAPQSQQQELLGRQEEEGRIRSLSQPQAKMSKSLDDPRGTILLSDQPSVIAQKIKEAQTDNLAQINYDWEKQPAITNLLTILAALSNQNQAEINRKWVGKTKYSQLKEAVIDEINRHLGQIQDRLTKIKIEDVVAHLEEKEAELNHLSQNKIAQLHRILGLRE